MEQLLLSSYLPSQLWPKRRPDRFLCWHACTQRFTRRRYTRPIVAASATRGNSRQTDHKGTPSQWIARFCHALFILSVTAKQRFKCSGMADGCGIFGLDTGAPQSGPWRQVALASSGLGVRKPWRQETSASGNLGVNSSRRQYRLPDHWRRLHRACDKAWNGRFSIGARPRTSVRDNARSQTG
jgi:hypothetical protein